MADTSEFQITLKAGEWLDAPHAVLDKLKSVKSETVTIDASASEPIGAQIAQLLLAAKKSASENAWDLKIVNASDEFLSSLETLGLASFLEEVIS